MGPTYFPLRWESTGDQWWFASPIDWAAANGHYDVVRELLHLDTNLLIKLTSLPRIRRLETVWDDDENFADVARCRSHVARKLLQECETDKSGHNNSLIRAGYGGWLLYTAASAADVAFVKELLYRDPLLVFGEGEYGVTDMLYAAARSKNCDVFKVLFDFAVSPTEEVSSAFRSEMVNRAVHAAARGGCVEILRDLLGGDDVLGYRDARGSTLLHTASGRGQIEVVKYLISSYDVIDSVDNRGNTSLNVAAYRGHLPVVEVLISASPGSTTSVNNYGDTFLHMAVSGFRAPSFRRMDRQIELMKALVSGNLVNMEDIINVQNNEGRTALHVAVIDNVQLEIVELLMSIRYIDLNIRDAEGNTPLDLLKQRPRSVSSEILIKRLISAGGMISDWRDRTARGALVSHLRMRGIGGSPGTSFRIPDSEILLSTAIEDLGHSSTDLTSSEYGYSGEIRPCSSNASKFKKSGSTNSATNLLKNLFRLPIKKEGRKGDAESDSLSLDCSSMNSPIPLRQRFGGVGDNKYNLPSPSTKKRFATGLTRGVLQVVPRSYFGSPSSSFSESSKWSRDNKGRSAGPSNEKRSPRLEKLKGTRKYGSLNLRLMNSYLCFGAQNLAVDRSSTNPRQNQDQHSIAV